MILEKYCFRLWSHIFLKLNFRVGLFSCIILFEAIFCCFSAFYVYPFGSTFVGTIPVPCSNDNCGISFADDSLTKRAYVTAIAPKSSAAKLNRTIRDTLRKLRGSFITHINDSPVFNSSQVKSALSKAQEKGGKIKLKFGLEPKLTTNKLRKAFDEFT